MRVTPVCPDCHQELARQVGHSLVCYWCRPCDLGAYTVPALRHHADPEAVSALWSASADAGVDPAGCGFCDRPLVAVHTDAVSVRMCRPCEAVWLTRAALDALAPGPAQTGSSPLGPTHCPVCGAPSSPDGAGRCPYCRTAVVEAVAG